MAVTTQGTLMWDVQNPMVGSTADPPSSLLPDVPHLSFSTGKVWTRDIFFQAYLMYLSKAQEESA